MGVALSTIGIKFGWAVETTAGTKPTSFTQIPRCIAIGGISLETDNIDVTPLETDTREYVAGLKDTGGTWSLTFSNNDDLHTAWDALTSAYETAKANNLATWAVIYIPNLSKSCYVTFEPGKIPLTDIAVSEALNAEISCTINEYKGWLTAVEPS